MAVHLGGQAAPGSLGRGGRVRERCRDTSGYALYARKACKASGFKGTQVFLGKQVAGDKDSTLSAWARGYSKVTVCMSQGIKRACAVGVRSADIGAIEHKALLGLLGCSYDRLCAGKRG